MHKRGQSEFVAYVLLVGLAVTLAAIIGIWSFNSAQKTSDNIVRQSNIQEKCDQVAIGSYVVCINNAVDSINITNTGSFTINEIRITNSETGLENCANKFLDIKPGQSKITKTLNNCNTAILLPLVKISDDEIIGCSEKKLVLKLIC